ncbi:PRC-barrel domain-containing protein [Pedobacter antarcticus]|uniref:PRC-barrel domain-containing protein n=1 Tax=Pedobacter antarcticus TaxID=34086 RepID=A0A1I2IQE3_9SPHI|nr:PRC-barrel domain-containing protein [Pedobacter antarcticus]SFF43868.1 PRC-barrel domain-containing protein [Pedobacter antarcticus]
MLYNVKSLVGFHIGATDGEIGKVEDFYFDDETWTIRYLVVKTGGWLSGRKVLISPSAVNQPDWENEIFPVNLTQEQIKNSPDIDTDKPVSRQQEIELYSHYAWPYYGIGGVGFYGGMGMTGMTETRTPLEESIAASNPDQQTGDPHLRSTSEVKGYQIHATDGEIGEVEDFVMDDNSWTLRFMVVDTGNWFPGKKVLISPRWLTDIQWSNSAVYLDLPVDAVKNSPEYDLFKPIPEVYETDLYTYYGKTF